MPYTRAVPTTGMYSYLGKSLAESAQGFLTDSLRDLQTRRFTPTQIAGNLNYRWTMYQGDAAARQSAISLAQALINAGLKPSVLAASLAAAAGYAATTAPTPITTITPPTPPPSVGGGKNGITLPALPPSQPQTVPSPASPPIAQPPAMPVSITVSAPTPGPTVVAGTSAGTPQDTSGPSAPASPVQASMFGGSSLALVALAIVGLLALPKAKGTRRH